MTACERLTGLRLLSVATVTADGRPMSGAVDRYLLHGVRYFSSGRNSVRMQHRRARIIATKMFTFHMDGEE